MPQDRALLVVPQVLLLLDRPAVPLVVVPEPVVREVLQEQVALREPVAPQVQALHLVRQPRVLQARSRVQYRQWALRLRAQA